MRAEEQLTVDLGRLLRTLDPVPADVVAAARHAFAWQDMDAALAELIADSQAEERRAPVAVRGTGARLLTYQAGDFTVEIEVTEVGDRLRVIGQVVPTGRGRVRVEQPAGAVEVDADALGRFAVAELVPGLTRFVCTPAAGPTVCTEWTTL